MVAFKLIAVLATAALAQENPLNLSNIYFPEGFLFGVGSSSYQIEGGWDADGKGENIWDKYLHENPEVVKDQSNGDVACDFYHKWKEDVQILKSLGVNSFRFSISWARILPNGFSNNVNEAGVTFYRNLISELKANNITPLVTMYHWDLPQALQDLGGVLNNNFVDWFGDYARLCFELFGDEVKYWATFNEAISFCVLDIVSGDLFPPAVNASGIYDYQCGHNVIRAHARAWHIYDTDFRATQNGKVGMVIVSHWFQAESSSTEHVEAADILNQFMLGWFANPLYHGDYPAAMKERIASRSELQGFSRSRLPEFTDEEKDYVKGTLDYLGLNVYIAAVARHVEDSDIDKMGWRHDSLVSYYQPDDWENSGVPAFKMAPWAVRGITKYIKDTYNDPEILITESGYPDETGAIEDPERLYFMQTYLSSAIEAIEYDDVKLIGFTYWSYLDVFEWLSGYTQKFGMVHVDFNDTNRNRTLKTSAYYYQKVTTTRCLVDECVNGTVKDTNTSSNAFSNVISDLVLAILPIILIIT